MSEFEIFNAYRMRYATGNENCDAEPQEVSEEVLLQPWREAKGQYLTKIFGDQLILEQPFSYNRQRDELRSEIIDFLDKASSNDFRVAVWNKACDLFKVPRQEWTWNSERGDWIFDDPDISEEIKDLNKRYRIMRLLNIAQQYDSLIDNHISLDHGYSYKLADGRRISIGHNEKPMRVIGKFVRLIGDPTLQEMFDKYCVAHSQILNQKIVSGTMCLSIHPLDYATASDNSNGWSSCMSWKEQGCYRIGTIEMMNSPMVICCYVRSDKNQLTWGYNGKSYQWNSKKWRAWAILDEHQCLINKQYPYDNSELVTFCLDWIRGLAKEKLGWDFDDAKMIHGENTDHHRGESFGNGFMLSYHTNKMYNDVNIQGEGNLCCLRHNYAKWWKPDSTIRINFSGADQCMCCGKVVDWGDHTEGSLFGPCCDTETGYYCYRCGRHITEDEVNWSPDGDDPYCEDCYCETYAHCEVCDSDAPADEVNEINVYIPRKAVIEAVNEINKLPEVDHDYDYLIESDWRIRDLMWHNFYACNDCCREYDWRGNNIAYNPEYDYEELSGAWIKPGVPLDKSSLEVLFRRCNLPGFRYENYPMNTRIAMREIWYKVWNNCAKYVEEEGE